MNRSLQTYCRASAIAMMLGAAPLIVGSAPAAAMGVAVSVSVAPPLLPAYVQPVIPEPGYIWVPGYWAWDGDDYYWVPGMWVRPPRVGLLWTPGYWAWRDGVYVFSAGYWGPTVGFYGGVNYGFGYNGVGFFGGEWRGGEFFYNRSVANIGSVHITNVYNRTVVEEGPRNGVSFNGGRNGTQAKETAAEAAASKQDRVEATAEQRQHEDTARSEPALRLKQNGGKPQVAAVQKPGDLRQAAPAGAAEKPKGETTPTGEAPKAEPPTSAAPRTEQPKPQMRPAPEPMKPGAEPITPKAEPAPRMHAPPKSEAPRREQNPASGGGEPARRKLPGEQQQ